MRFHRHHHPHPDPEIWAIKEIQYTMADFSLKDSDPAFTVSVSFTDANGHPAHLDGVIPTWGSSDPNVVALTSSGDGYSASGAPTNVGSVTITMDVTMPDGVVIHAEGVVDVTAGAPTAATLAFAPGA